MMDARQLEELIEVLGESDDPGRIERAAKKILATDPKNPMANLAIWQLQDDDRAISDIRRLEMALEEAELRISATPEVPLDAEDPLVDAYGCILVNLSFCHLIMENYDSALLYAEKLIEVDPEDYFSSTSYYFSSLLGLGEYDRIIQETGENADMPCCFHARSIALLEKGDYDGAAMYLLDAFSMDIELPFMILGMSSVDEEEPENDGTVLDATLLQDHWMGTDERTQLITDIVMVVGYLSGRLERDEVEEEMEGRFSFDELDAALTASIGDADVDKNKLSQDELDALAVGAAMAIFSASEEAGSAIGAA